MSSKKPGCLTALFGSRPSSKASPSKTINPYRLSSEFFSPAEVNFFQILKQMVGEHLLVFPKMALKEFIFITDQNNFQSHFNRIDRKHVDFLLCDPKTLQPKFAIELDDSSHRQASRGQRDSFIESTLAAAGLPLVRIPVRNSYNTEELGTLFKNALQRRDIQVASQEATSKVAFSIDNPPTCPNCGSKMVLRTAQKGNNLGEKFWGCPNYPKCRAIIKIT